MHAYILRVYQYRSACTGARSGAGGQAQLASAERVYDIIIYKACTWRSLLAMTAERVLPSS